MEFYAAPYQKFAKITTLTSLSPPILIKIAPNLAFRLNSTHFIPYIFTTFFPYFLLLYSDYTGTYLS